MAVAGQDRIWQVGEVAVLTAEYRNSSGTLTNPTTVTFKTKSPGGIVTSYTYANSEITRSSTGVYTKDITITESGKWTFGNVATGTVATASHETVTVAEDPFT